MSELAPPQLSSMLREELRKLLQAGVHTAKDISDAISPSALSRFLNGADEEAGLRINTFERILQKINGHIEVFFSSSGRNPVQFNTKFDLDSNRSVLHQPACLALTGGPAAIYGRNGTCYAVNDELRRLLGFTSSAPFFDELTPLHRDLKALHQFLQHSLRRIGDAGSDSSAGQNDPSRGEGSSDLADVQTPLRIFEVASGHNGEPWMFVGHVARLLDCVPTETIRREFGGELLVVTFSDAADIQLRLKELDTLWELVNDPASQINMHVVEPAYNEQTQQMDYSKVTFVSTAARTLLQIDKNAKDIKLADFVCADRDILAERMQAKFQKGLLTKNRSRTFHHFRRDGKVLPVAVHDFGVAAVRRNEVKPVTQSSPPNSWNQSPPPRSFAKIFTLWRQTRIPEDIMKILEIYGARNPVLGQAQIQSLVKLRAESEANGADYRFIYMNPLFRSKHEAKLRNLSQTDEPLDSEIFIGEENNNLRKEYHRIDDRVRRRAEETGEATAIERVERHRYPDRHYDTTDDVDSVHVVKIAVQERVRPTDTNKSWVLHVFFWPADRKQEEQVFAALRAHYSAWKILDALPLPVYAKDSTLSLLYANQAYLNDVRAVAASNCGDGMPSPSIESQRDVVGMGDGQFFEPSQALKYETDDRRLLSGHIPDFQDVEAHGEAKVEVWKKAISFPTPDSQPGDVRGIVGIYREIKEAIARPVESESVRPRRGRPPGRNLPVKKSLTSSSIEASLDVESGGEEKANDSQHQLRFCTAKKENAVNNMNK